MDIFEKTYAEMIMGINEAFDKEEMEVKLQNKKKKKIIYSKNEEYMDVLGTFGIDHWRIGDKITENGVEYTCIKVAWGMACFESGVGDRVYKLIEKNGQ